MDNPAAHNDTIKKRCPFSNSLCIPAQRNMWITSETVTADHVQLAAVVCGASAGPGL